MGRHVRRSCRGAEQLTHASLEEQVAPPPLHDEAVPMREYDEDDSDIRRYPPFWRRVIILVTVIIAAPVMMWTITIFFRSYVERPIPTFRHLTLTAASLPPKPPKPRRVPRHPCLPTLQGQPPVITWHHFLIHL